MSFDYHISHVPVKYLHAVDALSRGPTTHNYNEKETKVQEEVIQTVILTYVPAS